MIGIISLAITPWDGYNLLMTFEFVLIATAFVASTAASYTTTRSVLARRRK